MTHWSDAYYGPLYLDTVADLLTPRLSALEAERIASLLALGPRDRVLDLACGHGRHAWPLSGTVRLVVGVERSAEYLRRATARPTPWTPTPNPAQRAPAFLRADLRALPLRGGAIDAAFSWYSSLFMFDDEANAAALGEAARVVRRGGRVLVHHGNPAALALRPHDEARRILPDGSRVEEISTWDAATGVDRCARRLVRPDGTALEGTAHLRYYSPAEWDPLATRAGLRLRRITSTAPPPGGAPGSDAPDLIALLEKP